MDSSDPTRQLAGGLERIGTYLRSAGWQGAEACGLTPTQADILTLLARRGPLRLQAVAAELGVTRPTASDAVTTLVGKGHLEKHRDARDARGIVLHLTTTGRRLAKSAEGWPADLTAELETLPEAERAAMLHGLTRVIRGLQQRGAIPVQRMCATCRFFRPNTHDDPARPHHCAFVDEAFGDARLRLDCNEHDAATAPDAAAAWERFTGDTGT